jgi:hypothetical protein
MNLIDEDFSRLTARDLLLQQNEKLKVLEEKQNKHEERFEKFCDREFKKCADEVEGLVKYKSESVGVWKTVTGIAVLLGIIATLIALFK